MCVAIFCVTEVSQATWQLFIAAWVSSAGKLAQLHMMWLVHSDNSSVNKASYLSANPSLCSFIWPPRSFRCFLLLGRVCHNDEKFKNLSVILILFKTFLVRLNFLFQIHNSLLKSFLCIYTSLFVWLEDLINFNIKFSFFYFEIKKIFWSTHVPFQEHFIAQCTATHSWHINHYVLWGSITFLSS